MSENKTLVERLADFAVEARDGVPAEVAKSVRQRILDILGLCIAATALDTSKAVANFISDQGGRAEAHAIGVGQVTAAWAAFGNGVLAHSLDYDDTHLPSILHPSASVVPAAIAMAERTGASGRQLVGAIAAGVEITVRLGMAGYDTESNNSVFFEHGQHATSICGAVGSAAAASLLIQNSTAQNVADAMAIAVSMASGVIESNRTGGTVKRIHCGWAAHSGVVAADLAKRGITGPPTALEGRFGFYQAFLHGPFNASAITDDLGEVWSVPGIFFKPYPANHFTHTAVDAARELRERGVDIDSIEALHLEVASATVRTIGEPLEVKQNPETGYQAQFSGPYAVVVGLLGGGGLGADLNDYTDELAKDPRRRALMAKVTVGGSDKCDAIYPYQFPAVLSAKLSDGRTQVVEVLVNRGGADRPLHDDELIKKFTSNARPFIERQQLQEIEHAVRSLESADARRLMRFKVGKEVRDDERSE